VKDKAQQLHQLLNGVEHYLGTEAMKDRVRIFVSSRQLRDQLEMVVDKKYVDVLVGMKKRLS
jgi:flagellar biosynthesis component FlhA